jgi:hypothetical protein
MRRLRQQQRVDIHLDSEDEILGCRLATVEGSVATLSRVGYASAEVLERLIPAASGYLVFDYRGTTVALKGIATVSTAESEELAFVVTDGVQLPERRSNERVPLQAAVRISDPSGAGHGLIETVTENVSLTGALIERRDGLEGEKSFGLELLLGSGAVSIRCEAVIARQTPTHVGMQFTSMQAADRARLAVVIRDHTAD